MYVNSLPNPMFRGQVVRAGSTPELGGRRGLGFFDGLIGGIFNLFGQKDANKSAIKKAELEANAALEGARMVSQASVDVARIHSAGAERQALYAFAGEREAAQSRLQETREAYQSALAAQGRQARSQSQQATSDLVAQYTAQTLGLASTTITESADTMRVYPRWGTVALMVVAAVGVYGLTAGGKSRGRRSRGTFMSDRSMRRRTGRESEPEPMAAAASTLAQATGATA